MGVTTGQIDGWVARGKVHPLYRGVYLVGPVIPPHAHEMAAVLAHAPNAALSHDSAAARGLDDRFHGPDRRAADTPILRGAACTLGR